MELKIFRDALPAAGASCTVKAELPLETEILISDYLPPVFKLIKCFARPVVLQKQLQPGRLSIEGYLRCTVYYQGEGGAGLCQTEQKLPFNKTLEVPSFAFTAWTAAVEGAAEYINCRAVNPRRVEVRGAFGLTAAVHAQCKLDVVTALADCGVEQRMCTLSGVRSVAVVDKLVTADGQLAFPQQPAAVLDITGTARVGELRVLAGKAVVKGEVNVQCAWRAGGDGALLNQTATLSVNQVLDVDGLSEDCKCLCVLEPVGFTLTQGEGEAASALSATIMLHLRAWRPYQLKAVTDAFSTKYETSLTPQTVPTEALAAMIDQSVAVTGSGPLPDAGAKLLACFASFGPVQAETRGGKYYLAAKVFVTAFAENTLAEMESYEKTLDFALPLDIEAESGAELYPECWLSAESLQCACAGGTLEVSVTVRAEGAVLRRAAKVCAGALELGDELAAADPEISLRVYYAQAGEELFDIARRFHVSPQHMLEANKIDPAAPTLAESCRLLVPGA